MSNRKALLESDFKYHITEHINFQYVDETDLYFRYDSEDLDPKESWTLFCELQDELRTYGYEIDEPCIEHDCISGLLKPIRPT